MSGAIEDLLRRTGPALSSTLVERIVGTGISPQAARQRLSRAGGAVKRLKGVNFPNREKFLFLADQFTELRFRENLSKTFQQTGSAFGRAISGLKCRGGAVRTVHFPIATGLPTRNAK